MVRVQPTLYRFCLLEILPLCSVDDTISRRSPAGDPFFDRVKNLAGLNDEMRTSDRADSLSCSPRRGTTQVILICVRALAAPHIGPPRLFPPWYAARESVRSVMCRLDRFPQFDMGLAPRNQIWPHRLDILSAQTSPKDSPQQLHGGLVCVAAQHAMPSRGHVENMRGVPRLCCEQRPIAGPNDRRSRESLA